MEELAISRKIRGIVLDFERKYRDDIRAGWGDFDDLSGPHFPYNYYFRIEVHNKGDIRADDVSIETSLRGYYRFVMPDGTKKSGQFDNSLSIGNLKPRTTISVEVWTTRWYGDPKMVISYETGARQVAIAERAYGLTASFARSRGEWIFGISFVLLLAFLVIIASLSREGRGDSSGNAKSSSAADSLDQESSESTTQDDRRQ